MSRRFAAPHPPRTESSTARLAQDAVARGRAALAANEAATATRWLDRAHRLVPSDPNVMLSLASACLSTDPARAAGLFRVVAEQHDIRHAWLGLAAAQLRMAAPDAAVAPLAAALSGHAFTPDTGLLASQIAGSPPHPGWCGLTSGGDLKIQPAGAGGIVVQLDGVPLRGTVLPAAWSSHKRIDVLIGGRAAIGSPLRISRIRRVVGCVEAWQGGIRGWAWHPGDPDQPVVLTLSTQANGRGRTIKAVTETVEVAHAGPLARPRSFSLARTDLAGLTGPIRVSGPDGRDLLGSPVDPAAEEAGQAAGARLLARLYPARSAPRPPRTPRIRTPAPPGDPRAKSLRDEPIDPSWHGDPGEITSGHLALRADAPQPQAPAGADNRQRAVTIVIPVHNGAAVTAACLASVAAAATSDIRIIVVDDGSSDPDLIAALDDLARRGCIGLIRHPRALGFPASANAGLTAAAGRDVVLLNSDTLVPAGWLERLRAAAYSARDIGSVTPLSNDASVMSYPGNAGTNPKPDQKTTDRLDRLAQRANGGTVIDIPVGVGFCIYLRRDCLNATGLFRADIFAQGYGEENDFCLRARRLGWRHVALTGLFVGHHGGTSFDTSAIHLRARNARIVEQLHPGHDALIARFIADDPLAEARRRIDVLRWRAAGRGFDQAAILITHNDGGGVERCIEQAVRSHAATGLRPIVLRPAERPDGERAVAIHDGMADDYPNLVYAVPRESPALLRLLRAAKPVRVDIHHLLDHDAASMHALVAALGVPYNVHVHDYALFCPRLSLLGGHDRYCGEPGLADCEACIADWGHYLNEDITVAALRDRSADFLSRARSVVTPSDDARTRIRRHFPALLPVTVPHEDDGAIARSGPRKRTDGRLLVCVVGAIGVHKGFNVLLDCARDAARRHLDLEFVLAGHSIDDARLMATGRVFVTGRFAPDEAVDLIRAQKADLGFVPSIWPETWCLSLGDIWRAGLSVAAFDIGAPAERIRRTGRGFLLPLGLSASAINNALVVAAGADDYG